MFDFFKKLFRPPAFLGVDIGTASLKIVEIENRAGVKPLFKNYGYLESFEYLERGNAAFQTSTLKLEEQQIASYVSALVKQSGLASLPVVASLPSFSTFSTLIEVPKISETEIAQSMALQAKQYIPIPIADASLDWLKIGEREDAEGNKKIQLFLTSVPNDIVARYQRIFSLAGLELKALEIEGLSLARALSMGREEPTLIIDIGSRSTILMVAKAGHPCLTSQTDFAGLTLTQAIATGLGLSVARAEEIKRHQGLTGAGGPRELFTVLQPALDVIINEGARVRKNYETTYQEKVRSVVISGGGANLLGLDRYFSQELQLPTEKANPFAGLEYPEALEPTVNELGPLLSVAIGLSLKTDH